MDNTDYIESYFTNELIPDQVKEFEKRIESDPGFAEEVAFYLSALNISREVAQTEKKEYFKKLYQNKSPENKIPVKKISDKRRLRILEYYIAAAAAVVGIIIGTFTFSNNVSPRQLATQYEKEKLQNLGVTMGSNQDKNQAGLDLYNKGKYTEALSYFETLLRSDTTNYNTIMYAGLSALNLKKYDQALNWFKKLESYKLYSNPAILYQALTLMDRNQPNDDAQAKQLLQQIVRDDLDGKETAQDWLKRLK